jgi:HlyD family secretion protein
MVGSAALVSLACATREPRPPIHASGFIEATEIRVSAKHGGTIDTVLVEEGETVRHGQILARIDTTDAALALRAALAERSLVDAELRLAVAGPRPEERAEARAHLAQAEADLRGAEADLHRMNELVRLGSGAEKPRDDARTRRDVAAALVDVARERLRRLERGTRAEELDAAIARLAAADSRVDLLRRQVDEARIESPRAGVLTERLVEAGERVVPGTPLLVLTDFRETWLTAYVSETELGRLRIGQSARVLTDDGQERLGRLSFISSHAEFTPRNVQTRDERTKLVFRVRITLDNDEGIFKPGMPAEAELPPADAAS